MRDYSIVSHEGREQKFTEILENIFNNLPDRLAARENLASNTILERIFIF